MSSHETRLLIGIDGGGSKTVALLANADLHILGRGVAGPSNYQGIGADAAQAALGAAIAAAFTDAGLAPQPVAALCLGLAGMDRPADRDLFAGWAGRVLPDARATFVNDAELVLAAGTPGGWGVALICGTGSIAIGRDAAGRTARAGGWGYLLGDEGSGYAIGLAALRAVMCAYDGRGPRTVLTQAVLARWELAAPPALVPKVYQGRARPGDIAALATLVESAAAGGDETARRILNEAGLALALAVGAVVQELDLPRPTPCAQAGSVIVKGQVMAATFLDAARGLGLDLAPVTLVTEPAEGALRLARVLLKTCRG
ncbi:MAG: N-acetylglucosamine kinase [Chloroflexi bacterium]|nr:N-acetylglucosamine kinase [Chloroflexota bacterium]